MVDGARRRRDPEARRREIVTAATELIVEVGADALTHRMVAARAGVPLGATTQYFGTLDDLRAAALRQLADEIDARLDALRVAFETSGATPAVLATLIFAGLNDARAVQADRTVVTAAVHDATLRDLARHASDQLVGILQPTFGADRAMAATMFIDGFMWNVQLRDSPLDLAFLETALGRLLGEPETDAAASSPNAPAAP